jgi:hypothetical protein
MSFLELDDKEGLGMYLRHDFRLGKFVVNNAEGVEPLDFEYMLIDTDFQTGYGQYRNGAYDFVWDQQVGVKPDNAKELVADGYKRAFGARIYIKDKGVYLWQRFTLLEGQTFDEAMSSAWKDKVEGKVPCFKYTGSEKISFSNGSSGFKGKLDYVQWVDKPADFDEPVEMQEQPVEDDTKEDGIPF